MRKSVFLILIASISSAVSMVVPASAQAQAPNSASPLPIVATLADANTGLSIRQTTDRSGRLSVEVADAHVSIRKDVSRTGAKVTLSHANAAIVINLDEVGVTVEGIHGTQRLDGMDRDALSRERQLIARAPVVRDARSLLARLDLRPTTVAGSALLMTKVLIEAVVGDSAALHEYQAAITPKLGVARLVKAAYQKDGPGACWDAYEDYLMKIWNDFWQCAADNFDSWLRYACEFKWALQAELAMSWLISCNGGLAVR